MKEKDFFDEEGNRIRLDTRYLGIKSDLLKELERIKRVKRIKRIVKSIACIPCGIFAALTLPVFQRHPVDSLLELGTVLALTFIVSTIAELWRWR